MRAFIGLLIAACLALIFTAPAHAKTGDTLGDTSWVEFQTTDNGNTWYLDAVTTSAALKSTGNLKIFWVKIVNRDGTSGVTKQYLDCSTRTYRFIVFIFYDTAGRSRVAPGDSETKHIVPNSGGSLLADFVCDPGELS